MYATNYLETMVLNLLRGQNATAPAKLYAGLYMNSPGELGNGAEVAYSGYARQQITFSAPAALGGGLGVKNVAAITFPESPVALPTITHLGVSDSLTGGNMLLYAAFTDPAATAANGAPNIVAGEAQWWLYGDMSTAFRTKVLNLLRGQSATGFTAHMAFYNGSPEAGGAELSGSGYARVAIPMTAPAEQASGQMMISNSEMLTSPSALGAWGTWACTAVMDAKTGGAVVFFKERTAANIRPGEVIKIRQGELSLAMH